MTRYDDMIDALVDAGVEIRTVFGPPGTGKTTAMLGEIQRLSAQGVAIDTIGCLAYNKAICAEIRSRAAVLLNKAPEALPHFRTLHGMALTSLQRNPFKTDSRLNMLSRKALHEFADRYPWLALKGRDNVLEALNYHRESYFDAPDKLERLAANLSPGMDLLKVYADFKAAKNAIDYTDMLLMAYEQRGPLPDLEHLFIDEAQDLSVLQILLIAAWAGKCKTLTFYGDDDQCQPPTTKIMTSLSRQTRVDIGSLTTGDEVLAWNHRAGRGAASLTKRTIQTSERHFVGDILTIKTESGKTTQATPDHRFLVRWSTRETGIYAVYLMYRFDMGYRIGWCQLFNCEGALHLGARKRLEKADAAWILRICPTRLQASVQESILAAQYGIPTATFEPLHGSDIYTTDAVKQIFDAVDRDHGAKCLAAHGMSEHAPFWPPPDRISRKKVGKLIAFQVYGQNLIPGMFDVPVFDHESRSIKWERLISVERTPYDGPVVSLNVEQQHTYIADDIVVHNCIFNFRAGMQSGFLRALASHKRVLSSILSQSYRVPKTVHRVSQRLIRINKDRVDKPYAPTDLEGAVSPCPTAHVGPHIKRILDIAPNDTCAILVRVNAQSPVYINQIEDLGLIYDNHTFNARQSILGVGNFADDFRAIRTACILHAGDVETPSNIAHLIRTSVSEKAEGWWWDHVKDSPNTAWTLDAIEHVMYQARYLISRIRKDPYTVNPDMAPFRQWYIKHHFDALLAQHASGFHAPVQIMTMHASKGLEFDHVFVDSAYRDMAGNLADEVRLNYVACTRARKSLHLITSPLSFAYGDLLRELDLGERPVTLDQTVGNKAA